MPSRVSACGPICFPCAWVFTPGRPSCVAATGTAARSTLRLAWRVRPSERGARQCGDAGRRGPPTRRRARRSSRGRAVRRARCGGCVAAGMTASAEDREMARTALEQVCARGDMALAPRCYAEDFVDHVGRVEYRGLEGVRRSTGLYRRLFDDLAFDVVDQVAEGDRVASRWVLSGRNRGRAVRLHGITMSRLRGGRIVEDWNGFDRLELLHALGVVRTVRSAPALLRALRAARAA